MQVDPRAPGGYGLGTQAYYYVGTPYASPAAAMAATPMQVDHGAATRLDFGSPQSSVCRVEAPVPRPGRKAAHSGGAARSPLSQVPSATAQGAAPAAGVMPAAAEAAAAAAAAEASVAQRIAVAEARARAAAGAAADGRIRAAEERADAAETARAKAEAELAACRLAVNELERAAVKAKPSCNPNYLPSEACFGEPLQEYKLGKKGHYSPQLRRHSGIRRDPKHDPGRMDPV